jgi:hypothetical protein
MISHRRCEDLQEPALETVEKLSAGHFSHNDLPDDQLPLFDVV